MARALKVVLETRRARLAQLLDEIGQQELGNLTGIAPAYLWQMGKGEGKQKRGISDDNAAVIERGVGKQVGWLSGETEAGSQSQTVGLDLNTIVNTTKALLVFMRRRDPKANLDLTDPADAELFMNVYALALESKDEMGFAASVADLIEARGKRNGRPSGKNRGDAGGENRKAVSG